MVEADDAGRMKARIRELEADVQSGVEFADGLKARIRELEAENQRLTEFGEAAVIHAAESNDQIDVIEALAAQIEAALAEQHVTIGETGDPDLLVFLAKRAEAVGAILSADSEVRARILAAHDAEVERRGAERAWDELYSTQFDGLPISVRVTMCDPNNPYRAAEKREEADRD